MTVTDLLHIGAMIGFMFKIKSAKLSRLTRVIKLLTPRIELLGLFLVVFGVVLTGFSFNYLRKVSNQSQMMVMAGNNAEIGKIGAVEGENQENKPGQNAADHVIANNKSNAKGAVKHVFFCRSDSFRRCLHQCHKLSMHKQVQHCQKDCGGAK